jgi:hypothetical protein
MDNEIGTIDMLLIALEPFVSKGMMLPGFPMRLCHLTAGSRIAPSVVHRKQPSVHEAPHPHAGIWYQILDPKESLHSGTNRFI